MQSICFMLKAPAELWISEAQQAWNYHIQTGLCREEWRLEWPRVRPGKGKRWTLKNSEKKKTLRFLTCGSEEVGGREVG